MNHNYKAKGYDCFVLDETFSNILAFPCSVCNHRHGTDKEEPCNRCEHNSSTSDITYSSRRNIIKESNKVSKMPSTKVWITEQNFNEAKVRASLDGIDVVIYINRLLDAYFATETRP